MKNCQSNKTHELINNLYSLNYSCLKATNIADKPDGVMHREDVFKKHNFSGLMKASIEKEYKEKIEQIASTRNTLFEAAFEAIEESKDEIKTIKTKIYSLLKEITDGYNSLFGEHKKTNELIDGFSIIDKNLDNFITEYYFDDELNTIFFNPFSISLLSSYTAYLSLLATYMDMSAAVEITNALSGDVTSRGYKSFDFGVGKSSSLMKLTRDDIKKISDKANGYLAEIDSDIKKVNIELIKSKRQLKKRKNKNNGELIRNHTQLTCEIHKLNEQREPFANFADLVKVFEDRLQAANTDFIFNKKSAKFWEKAYDFLSGISFIKNNEPVSVDEIYIHELELSYYKFLLNQVMEIRKTNANKSNESQKQPE